MSFGQLARDRDFAGQSSATAKAPSIGRSFGRGIEEREWHGWREREVLNR
jgi:hypothetical protein